MVLSAGRSSLALRRGVYRSPLTSNCWRQWQTRAFAASPIRLSEDTNAPSKRQALLDQWIAYKDTVNLPLEIGKGSELVGFMGKRRNVSKQLSFADLTLPSGEVIQLCSNADIDEEGHKKFREVLAHSPVLVRLHDGESMPNNETLNDAASKPTVNTRDIQPLNSIPKELIVTPEVMFPPTKRHLQIRFHPELHARLRFRSWLKGVLNEGLIQKGFTDVETPTLFKSTPEGAREFLVPTRQKGKAYALTQSPQQYKQVLISGGIGRYMQWARCYRDEDNRADRQPEFSQLDMEWAFAGADIVKQDVSDIVLKALSELQPAHSYQDIRGERIPVLSKIRDRPTEASKPEAHKFTNLTFSEAIAAYGSDKPDLRIPSRIHPIPIPESAQHFVSMITYLSDPLIEGFAFSLNDSSPEMSRRFVNQFMDNLPASIAQNGDGLPQILIYDTSKPLCGFSSIGFDHENLIDAARGGQELKDGDLVIFQARKKQKGQYSFSSTKIGEIRSLLWRTLVDEGLMDKPRLGDPGSLQFVWVTEFPMFKPLEEDEPWQAEAAGAGIAACHHPFTAPLSRADFETLFTDPLQAKSGAYDLVLNGTEIGGGSERNHIADVQDFIMRDVLKMPKQRLEDFSHLFEALRAGCPPHAGFALGFDRMVALLTDTTTVRDVMAFPKTMKGEDPFVKSPSKIRDEQLAPYGLALRGKSS